MTEIKDIFANKLSEEMKTYGHTNRSMASYTAIPEHRFEEFLNHVALPNREEIKRIAKVLHVEDAILRVAAENSDPLARQENSLEAIIAKAKSKAEADRIAQGKPLVIPTSKNKPKAEAETKQPVKKTAKIKATIRIEEKGPALLSEREAELFRERFVDSLSQPNAKEIRKALGLMPTAVHNYLHGKQAPFRKRALKLMTIMDKLNPVTVNVESVRLAFRTALGNAIDREGSVNKVAAYLGKSNQIVNKWYTGKILPTPKNMIELTDHLNKLQQISDSVDQIPTHSTQNQPECKALVIKPEPQPDAKDEAFNSEVVIDYRDKIIADHGIPRLRTVERKKFMTCLAHVEAVTSKDFLTHLIGKKRVERFQDMSRTIGRPEAIEILKSIQPIAASKGLKVSRKAGTLTGTYKTASFDVVRKTSTKSTETITETLENQPEIQIMLPIAQPKLDELGGKVLTVIDYHGNRRPLKEWLDELNTPLEDLAVIYNLEFAINHNALETQTVTISGLGNVYEYIQHKLMKSADTIDVKLTFGSCFNDPLVVHYLRYIK